MPSNTRSLTWTEGIYDQTQISKSQVSTFSLAQIVKTAQSTKANVIWKSKVLCPKTTITWEVDYAINWTASTPDNGVSVEEGGNWTPCNKGDTYDLDTAGNFVKKSGGDPAWMTIGQVSYVTQDNTGVHIMVGIKNGDSYDSIFVDEAALASGGGAKYQPQEQMQWWLSASSTAGAVFKDLHTEYTTQDFSKPNNSFNTYAWSTSFLWDNPLGQHWIIADVKGNNTAKLLGRPIPSANTFLATKPIVMYTVPSWVITAGGEVGKAVLAATAAYLVQKLESHFKEKFGSTVEVEGKKITITCKSESAKTDFLFLAYSVDEKKGIEEIKADFASAKTDVEGFLSGEPWKVQSEESFISGEAEG